jgi:hypothetical protein
VPRCTTFLLLLLALVLPACGGDDADDAAATAAVTATGMAGGGDAQLALTVQVPQYLDDIRSGANPGGRDEATDKLIAVLREHREALGDAVVVKTLEEAADYAGQYCAACSDELAAEAASVSAGSDGY